MFSNIPTILTADELLEKAFHSASRIVVSDREKFYRTRSTAVARLQAAAQIIDSTLKKYVEAFPSFERLHPFYYELTDLLIGVGRLKKSLGAIDWCRKRVLVIAGKHTSQIKRTRNEKTVENLRKSAYGRISSVVQQVGSELEFLNKARDELGSIPSLDTEAPTIVVAGYPNVGKSSLVKLLSSATPRIAPYPFTTTSIHVGYYEHRWMRYQFIDTPGLFDRPIGNMKKAEKQAMLALKHLADLIIFILDSTDHCGYPVEEQKNLLSEMRKIFDVPIIVVENKADIKRRKSEYLSISAVTGEGIDTLRKDIIERLREPAGKRI